MVWEGDITFKAGVFKFRSNNAWDPNPNLGGSLDALTNGGSDIASPGEGTYHVVLDLTTYPAKATLTKK